LILLLPDGFNVLFAPAAALPALLPTPLLGAPVVVPVDDPVVPTDEPVVAPAAGLPAAEPPPAAPAPPACAKASVLVSANAAASLIVASFMILIPRGF
jgi:hypothetical protein